jgi:hypothetical protein
MTVLPAMIVGAAGVYLLLLAAATFAAPRLAERFLGGFAGSLRAHAMEQGLRLVAGIGFVSHAPRARFPLGFEVFGWVLIATSAALLLIPWRWHQRFAQRVVPPLLRHKRMYGVAAGALGALVLWAMWA